MNICGQKCIENVEMDARTLENGAWEIRDGTWRLSTETGNCKLVVNGDQLLENGTQMTPKNYVPRSRFRSILLICFEHRLWDAFWSPCGSLLVPLAPFWLTFGALWLTFWYPSRSIFSFLVAPGVILHILLYFRRKSYVESYF